MVKRGEVIVNKEYQRSDKVWPSAAQSFLIETILLGYPIPKLSLHQVTDLKTKKTIKEIVDGQQRTKAVKAFYDGSFRLSRTLTLEEAAGHKYSDLPKHLQSAFLDYALSVDIFTGASNDQIREVFRRINSYTVPLNPEEQRHATYQGAMKWFIYALSRKYDEAFLATGTFTQANLVRMADTKLFGELIHAMRFGILTTKKSQLDDLYHQYDDSVPQKVEVEKRLAGAINLVLQMREIHDGPLMKAHMMYSLLLAIMHVSKPLPPLQKVRQVKSSKRIVPTDAEGKLSELSEVLEEEDPPSRFLPFVRAGEQKTNVRDQREVRFEWLVDTLLRS